MVGPPLPAPALSRWHGVEFFALELSPAGRTPVPMRSLPEIAGSGELERALADATA